jgi:exonuclease III
MVKVDIKTATQAASKQPDLQDIKLYRENLSKVSTKAKGWSYWSNEKKDISGYKCTACL